MIPDEIVYNPQVSQWRHGLDDHRGPQRLGLLGARDYVQSVFHGVVVVIAVVLSRLVNRGRVGVS
ncbi:MAG TPA: hypothetical protein VGL69_11535 [Solirubrobacteraceae bacterium]